MNLAVHVLTGNERGKEFPIPENGCLKIGLDADGCLQVDSDRSELHQISVLEEGGTIFAETLTGGGPRKALKEGDRLALGKVKMMIVALTRFSPAVTSESGGTQFIVKSRKAQQEAPSIPAGKSLSGSLSEVSLADILQFLTQSRMDGHVRLELADKTTGRIYISSGRIINASWKGQGKVSARRILFRLLGQTSGTFSFGPTVEPVSDEIDQSADSILLEGMQSGDETREKLEVLGSFKQTARVERSKGAVRLRELSPEELDVFELCLVGSTILEIMNGHPTSDLEALQSLEKLVNAGWVAVDPPAAERT